MTTPDLLVRPELLETDDCSDACTDCPKINTKPPKESDCPNFDASFSPPVCIDDSSVDGFERQFIGFGHNLNFAVADLVLRQSLSEGTS